MQFTNAAWKQKPVQTTIKVAKSLFLKRLKPFSKPTVEFDGGRSRIIADLSSPLGLELFRYGVTSPELEFIGKTLRTGETFIDAGANIGMFTLVAASRVGPNGRVVSIEASAITFKKLCANITINNMHWVKPYCIGLAATSGERQFVFKDGLSHFLASADATNVGNSLKETVTAKTLDQIVNDAKLREIALIKMDIEGAELECLRGAQQTLTKYGPKILTEINEEALARQGTSGAAVFAELRQYGYKQISVISPGNVLFDRARP